MVSARDAAPTLLCALLLALPLAACQEPASPAGNLVRQRADGSTRSLTARSSRAGTTIQVAVVLLQTLYPIPRTRPFRL